MSDYELADLIATMGIIVFLSFPVVFLARFEKQRIVIPIILLWLLTIACSSSVWLLTRSYFSSVVDTIIIYVGMFVSALYCLFVYRLLRIFSNSSSKINKIFFVTYNTGLLFYILLLTLVIYAKYPRITPKVVFWVCNKETVYLAGTNTVPSFIDFYRPCNRFVYPELSTVQSDYYISLFIRSNAQYKRPKKVKVVIELLDNNGDSVCYIVNNIVLYPDQSYQNSYKNIQIIDRKVQQAIRNKQIKLGKHYARYY